MSDSDNKFYCEVCQKSYSNISALNKHKNTESHLKRELIKKEEGEEYKHIEHKGKKEASDSYFYCPICNYETKRQNDMTKHIESSIHKKSIENYKKYIEYKKGYIPKGNIRGLNDIYTLKIGNVKDFDNDENKYIMKNVSIDDLLEHFELVDENDKLILMKDRSITEQVIKRRERQKEKREKDKFENVEKKPNKKINKEEIKQQIKDIKKKIEINNDLLKTYDEQKELYNEQLIKSVNESSKVDFKKMNKELDDIYKQEIEKIGLTKKELLKEINNAKGKYDNDVKMDKDDKYYFNLYEKIEKVKDKYLESKKSDEDVIINPEHKFNKIKSYLVNLNEKLRKLEDSI